MLTEQQTKFIATHLQNLLPKTEEIDFLKLQYILNKPLTSIDADELDFLEKCYQTESESSEDEKKSPSSEISKWQTLNELLNGEIDIAKFQTFHIGDFVNDSSQLAPLIETLGKSIVTGYQLTTEDIDTLNLHKKQEVQKYISEEFEEIITNLIFGQSNKLRIDLFKLASDPDKQRLLIYTANDPKQMDILVSYLKIITDENEYEGDVLDKAIYEEGILYDLTKLAPDEDEHEECQQWKKAIEIISDKTINLDDEDEDGFTPLYYLLMNNQIEAAEILISKGANINHISSKSQKSYLATFLEKNLIDEVNFLIKNGATFDSNTLTAAINLDNPEVNNHIINNSLFNLQYCTAYATSIGSIDFINKTTNQEIDILKSFNSGTNFCLLFAAILSDYRPDLNNLENIIRNNNPHLKNELKNLRLFSIAIPIINSSFNEYIAKISKPESKTATVKKKFITNHIPAIDLFNDTKNLIQSCYSEYKDEKNALLLEKFAKNLIAQKNVEYILKHTIITQDELKPAIGNVLLKHLLTLKQPPDFNFINTIIERINDIPKDKICLQTVKNLLQPFTSRKTDQKESKDTDQKESKDKDTKKYQESKAAREKRFIAAEKRLFKTEKKTEAQEQEEGQKKRKAIPDTPSTTATLVKATNLDHKDKKRETSK